ncbi:MAG: serine/threonine protein kinase [Betaproteobacteria bacterium]|nr:serine/threonine protein kinase [Betaproteobacteria bacterium]
MKLRKLGRYELVTELGHGAMGIVYRATDPVLNRVVAIKTINMALKQDEIAEYEARFYQEARAAGGLNHPNIVTVYDIGKTGSMAYMAMEYLEGDELRVLLAPGAPLPLMQAVDIATQVADGLAYAHEHDVVHRDIKPANIMITQGGLAKITDFGIARMRSAKVVTQTGVVLGSPKYMSPEQVLGRRAEARSDIFSLGAVLYEMLTGKAPFLGADVHAMMFQTLNLVPPPPSTFNPAVPAMLDLIVAKMLAKAPDDRYSSARELAADLRECRKLVDIPSLWPPAPAATVPQARSKGDSESAAPLLANPYPSTRREDVEQGALDPSPTLGLAKSFDSLDAARRLAEKTGAMHVIDEFIQTEGQHRAEATTESAALVVAATPSALGGGWSRRDRVTFAASVAVATAVAATIVLL